VGLNREIQLDYDFRIFRTREQWVKGATQCISEQIQTILSEQPQALVALSGGSTPIPVYKELSKTELNWKNVRFEMVDERITTDLDGLNRNGIEQVLDQNAAANARFWTINMSELAETVHIDLSIMGMGTDGHTASWFPGSSGLREAMDLDSKYLYQTIQADGCPGAGKFPSRNTMTLPTIMNSRRIILLLTGKEKRRVFEDVFSKSVYDAPVKALLAAGPRLTVMWAL